MSAEPHWEQFAGAFSRQVPSSGARQPAVAVTSHVDVSGDRYVTLAATADDGAEIHVTLPVLMAVLFSDALVGKLLVIQPGPVTMVTD